MGEAITRRFVEKGWTVHAVARDASSLQKLADELGVVPHAVDLRDLAALTAAVSGLEVDVFVNCAGVSRQGNILDSTPDDLDSLVDVNLRAVLHLTRILLPGMVERDRATSSTSAPSLASTTSSGTRPTTPPRRRCTS